MKDRILGLLIGCAYGDAMGMPSEMMSRETLEKAFPEGVHGFLASTPYDFIGRNFESGTVTDDTINTLLVCDSIIETNGKFNTEKYIQSLQKWVKENGDKNPYIMGPSTLKALTSISNGTPISKSGLFGTTNGSAMKVSPLGIICDYKNLKNLVDTVESLCMPTHNTSIAIAGASVIATLASYALRENVDIETMWNLASSVIDECKGKGNDLPSASLKKRLECVKKLLLSKSEEEILSEIETIYGAGMETIETIPTVMVLLHLSQFEPHRCAELAANLSGDTDTIGAIATAICGAANNNFTSEEIEFLENVNNINFEDYALKLEKYFVK
ncbi:MAG: ADP-ribosylglycohydrolase family protein [Erysipelotrichaceae bacterium]|nr:ADP-ribosylglycohydrolase family protein [Erysipelotrichaceae bacterium]